MEDKYKWDAMARYGIKRYGMMIKIKPEGLEEWKRLHDRRNSWPEVVNAITNVGHMRNFNLYYKDGYAFGYFEYHGDDLEVDEKKLKSIPIYKKWLSLNDPLQEPLETRKPGEWWAYMEEVYHQD